MTQPRLIRLDQWLQVMFGDNPPTRRTIWRSHSDRRGNQSGTDADGNTWNYNRDTNTYFNHGTGEMCTGSGYARVCF